MLQLSIQNPCTELLENTKRAKEREKCKKMEASRPVSLAATPLYQRKRQNSKEQGGTRCSK
jgi:hypothetical protein